MTMPPPDHPDADHGDGDHDDSAGGPPDDATSDPTESSSTPTLDRTSADTPGRRVTPAGRRPPPRRTGVFVDADELRAHVGDMLGAILGGYEVDAFGNYTFTHDGARVFVSVTPTPVGLAINVHSVTNVDLDLDEALARFLVTTNHRLGFGALSYDEDNRAVWLRQSLLGTTLDAPELRAAVATVAQTAAAIDDDIQQRFGGRTFDQAPADFRAATAPPRPRDHGNDDGNDDDGLGDDGATQAMADNASGYL